MIAAALNKRVTSSPGLAYTKPAARASTGSPTKNEINQVLYQLARQNENTCIAPNTVRMTLSDRVLMLVRYSAAVFFIFKTRLLRPCVKRKKTAAHI